MAISRSWSKSGVCATPTICEIFYLQALVRRKVWAAHDAMQMACLTGVTGGERKGRRAGGQRQQASLGWERNRLGYTDTRGSIQVPESISCRLRVIRSRISTESTFLDLDHAAGHECQAMLGSIWCRFSPSVCHAMPNA